MSGTLRNITAGGVTTEGTYTPPNLFAGEQDIITTSLPLAASTAIVARQVLALNAAGNLVPLNPAGTGETASETIAVAIAVEAAASAGSVRNVPVYVGGFFDHEALAWPAGTAYDTLAERRAAFLRTNITIGSIPAVRA